MGLERAERWVAGAISALAASLLACSPPGAFECSSDAACRSSQGDGWCEETNFCSFPDDTCDSGRRYGALAGAGLGSSCVELEGTSTGHAETSPASSATTRPPTSTTFPAESTTTGPDPVATEPATSEDTLTTGGPPVTCPDPLLHETFTAGWSDPQWTVELGTGRSVGVADGELVIGIEDGMELGYAGLTSVQVFDIGKIAVDFQLVAPLDYPGLEAETLVFVEDDDLNERMGFAVYDGSLQAVVTDPAQGPTSVAYEPYDAEEHRWLRMEATPDQVTFLTSPDGAEWNLFGEASTPDPSGAPAHLRVRAGAWTEIDFVGEARFDDVRVCTWE